MEGCKSDLALVPLNSYLQQMFCKCLCNQYQVPYWFLPKGLLVSRFCRKLTNDTASSNNGHFIPSSFWRVKKEKSVFLNGFYLRSLVRLSSSRWVELAWFEDSTKMEARFKVHSHGRWALGSSIARDDAWVALCLALPTPGMKERDTWRQRQRQTERIYRPEFAFYHLVFRVGQSHPQKLAVGT